MRPKNIKNKSLYYSKNKTKKLHSSLNFKRTAQNPEGNFDDSFTNGVPYQRKTTTLLNIADNLAIRP